MVSILYSTCVRRACEKGCILSESKIIHDKMCDLQSIAFTFKIHCVICPLALWKMFKIFGLAVRSNNSTKPYFRITDVAKIYSEKSYCQYLWKYKIPI